MSSNAAGVVSIGAATTGLLALLGDVLSIIVFFDGPNVVSTALGPVVVIADLAGLLVGRFAAGRTGFHLSWAPAVVMFLVLAAFRPQTAAGLVEQLIAVLYDVFNGLADVITSVLT